MESAPGTPSVIAKLMGLDESPPHPPVQKQRRVLSENYLRRVASIGVREKHHSFRLKVDETGFKDVFEVVDALKADKHDNLSVAKGNTNSDLSEPTMEFTRQNDFQVTLEMMDYEDGHFSDCLQGGSLLNNHLYSMQVSPSNSQFGLHNLLKFPSSQLKSNKEGCFPSTGIDVLKLKHRKAENSARCVPSSSSLDVSHSGDRKCLEFPSPGSGKIHTETKERKNLAYDVEPISLRSTFSRERLGKLARNTKYNRTTKVSRLGSRGGNLIAMETELMRLASLRHQSSSYSDESYVAREAKKQLSERWKMTKKFEVRMARRGITLGNFLSMPSHETGPRKKLVRHDLKDLDLNKFRTQQDKYVALCNEWNLKPKGSINWGEHKSREYKFNQNDGLTPIKLRFNRKKLQSYPGLGFKVIDTPVMTSGKFKKRQSGPRACLFVDRNDDSCTHITDTSVQQETSTELFQKSPFLLHCTTQPDCMASLEEVYQPSPVSVLEPQFRGERLPTPECLGQMNVDEYSDTYSEGSGMIVSSDDETNEGSAKSDRENEDLMRLFIVEESRDFPYLVDVLSEIDFYGRNTISDLGASHSPEWPVSLSVFETLEKKFGDQISWKRSDRRLLFDRINAGLMDILEPGMGVPAWTKPVSRRFRCSPGHQKMIEENLWMLLVSQEKEIRKDLAEKVLGSEIELDLGDDIDGIGREIERFLFDELVAEFVSLES